MADHTFVTFALFLFATFALAADDHGVTFLYPPAFLTFHYMDTVNVTYTSPFAKPKLYTFCTKPHSTTILQKTIQSVSPHNGSSLVLISWPEVDECYFNLRPNSSSGYGANSHFINVLAQARSTPVIGSLGSLLPNDTTSSIVTVTAAPQSDDGMSSGAKIGIGVGVAVGLSLVAAALLAVFLLRRRRKAKLGAARGQLLDADNDSGKSQFGYGQEGQSVPLQSVPLDMQYKDQTEQVQKLHELGSETAFELGTDTRVGELSAEGQTQQSGIGARRLSSERSPVR